MVLLFSKLLSPSLSTRFKCQVKADFAIDGGELVFELCFRPILTRFVAAFTTDRVDTEFWGRIHSPHLH